MTDTSAAPAQPDNAAAPAAATTQPAAPAGAHGGQTPPAATTPPTTNTPPVDAPKGDAAPVIDPPKDGTPPPANQEFKIPEEFKDKSWASKVKSQEDLWKQLANTQELIGKKSIVPDLTKATPEEKEAYYAQTRPKSAEEYQFTADVLVDPEMKTAIGEMLLKNGISATQGSEIIKTYQAAEAKLLEAQYNPDTFKQTMEKAFGTNWEKITGHTRNSLKSLVSSEDNKMLDSLPNSYVALIYRTLGNVVKAYGVRETDAAHLQSGGSPATTDVEGVRQTLRNEMAVLRTKPGHTFEQLQTISNKLADTYKNDPRLSAR